MKITSINKRYTKNHDNIACNIDSAITNHVIDMLYEKLHFFKFKDFFRLSIMENEETILQIEKLSESELQKRKTEGINPFLVNQINEKLSEIASERKNLLEEIANKTGIPLEESEE